MRHPASELRRPYADVYMARQPIFDAQGKTFGYELLFRDGLEATVSRFDDPDQATLAVAACLDMAAAAPGMRLLVNFTERLLLERLPLALPAEALIVEILETVHPRPDVLDALREIKAAGYILAVDDFMGQEGCEPLLELADIVKVDVLDMDAARLTEVTAGLKPLSCRLLAEKVDSPEMRDVALGLGYELFQGFFFARPQNLSRRNLSSRENTRLGVLAQAEAAMDAEELVAAIRTDVGVSLKLMRFINSSAIALPQRVDSLRRAVLLLGPRQLRRWLRLVVLADMVHSDACPELHCMALMRARFFERLAESCPAAGCTPDSVFLLGLFSLLEPLLRLPMTDIVAELPLPEEMRAALSGTPGQEYDWLLLTQALETGDWEEAERLAEQLRLTSKAMREAFGEAMTWSAKASLGLR